MHGLIFAELKKFAESAFGKPAWPEILKEAELAHRTYLTGDTYPDAEVVALVTVAAKRAKHGMRSKTSPRGASSSRSAASASM